MDRVDGLVSKLFSSLKTYLGLQKEYAMLELTEKLSRLLTALILGAILFVMGIFAVFFLALSLSSLITLLTGSAVISYLVMTLLFVIACATFYRMRHKWLEAPLTNFFTNLLLKDYGEKHDPL